MEIIKRFAGDVFNALPDRVNLFGRYMTGVGGDNLQLDRSTEQALIRGTEQRPTAQVDLPADVAERLGVPAGTPLTVDAAGPGVPVSGPVTDPYKMGADKAATQTLGRYHAEVTPDTVRVKDVYDMANEHEDPDLISGKFQPKKAINNLIQTFDHSKQLDYATGNLVDAPRSGEGYNTAASVQDDSPTRSKATDFARSLMYLSPIKPKAFEVDYLIER